MKAKVREYVHVGQGAQALSVHPFFGAQPAGGQAAPNPLRQLRWVVSSPSAVSEGTYKYTAAEMSQIVQSGNGAEPGRILHVVREDGIVVAAYAGARTGKAWLPISVDYEGK